MSDERKTGWRAVLAVVLIFVIAVVSAYILHDTPENIVPPPALPTDIDDFMK